MVARSLILAVPLLGAVLGAQPRPAAFEAVRPAVLGYSLEREIGGVSWRLVHAGRRGAPEVVLTGTRRACETRMLELLEREHGTGRPNLALPTLGGRQLWADELVYCGWRIQRHVLSEHHRLLDPNEIRRAWGSFEACRVVLERERVRRRLAPNSTHVVLLVHGLGRSRSSLKALAQALEHDGYAAESVGYPSTRASIAQHAAQLSRIIGRLEGAQRLSFVTHSLGGIVVRELLRQPRPWSRRIGLGRLVMLGPPNQGSAIVDLMQESSAFRLVAGRAATGLTPERIARLPAPPLPFGVIAGGRGDGEGRNPLLEGDDDGVVRVASTKLGGMADFLLVDELHTFLMRHPRATAAVLHFLATGRFPGH